MDTASGTGPSFTVAVGPEGLRVTVTLLDERTFVFTDIELSSAHWQRDEEAMCRVMPSHHQLIEAAFCKWRGTVLRGEGDSCVALFPSPVDALEASGDIQRELGRAPWEVDLKVRVGLHTGRVYQLSESEYGGTPLNYLGRLHMAGHGGQILVSDITASLLDAELPTGWELIDRRLRPEGLSAAPHLPSRSSRSRTPLSAAERRAADPGPSSSRQCVHRAPERHRRRPFGARQGRYDYHGSRRYRQDKARARDCARDPGRVPRRRLHCRAGGRS
jgi:class 3 adenylate cyclase